MTGISAPPIGRIKRNPIAKDAKTINQKYSGVCTIQNFAIRPMIAIPITKLRKCWPLKTKGFPVTIPCSFPKAIIEPVKVIAPIAVPSAISIRLPVGIDPTAPMSKASGL